MEKQLLNVNQKAARGKAQRGEAMTLKELAVVIGMSYGEVRSWNLPRLGGKIFYDDFILWRRRQLGFEFCDATATNPALQGAGKFGEPLLTHG